MKESPLTATGLHPTAMKSHRFHLLDALRGIAAICVAAGHFGILATRLRLHSTHLAVDFFFCLSGFVIAFSYERRLEDGMGLGAFLTGRLVRLYPVYLLGITLGLLYDIRFGHSFGPHLVGAYLLAVILVPNLRLVPSVYLFPLDIVSWSLFLEIVANIVYACLIKVRLAASVAIGLASLFAFLALGYGLSQGNTLVNAGVIDAHAEFPMGFARVIGSFGLGVLALRLFRGRSHMPLVERSRAWVAAIVVGCFVLILIPPTGFMDTDAFHLVAMTVLFPALIYIGARSDAPPFFHPACAFLGDMSYPLYLIHLPFVAVVGSRILPRLSPAFQLVTIAVCLVAFVGLAFLIARRLDAPIRRNLMQRYQSVVSGRVPLS